MASIDDYRKKIDEIDHDIVTRLEERMRTVEQIAKFKQENELPVYDAMREREKLDSITNMV